MPTKQQRFNMATRNDVTGQEIKSRGNSEEYKNNWDAIFAKKKEVEPEAEDTTAESEQE